MNLKLLRVHTLGVILAVAACAGQPSPAGAQQSADLPQFVQVDPHMKMTDLKGATPEDSTRAWALVETLRGELDPYQDHERAMADGYQPFLPRVAGKETHFTNRRYAVLASLAFEPGKPTSLLYERDGDDYRLVGAMFTAPASVSVDELDERVPLAFGQWHLHVNVCLPPRGRRRDLRDFAGPNARFGPAGSIATREECEAAGGRFKPSLFGWMLHVYPWEETLDLVFQPPANHREGHGQTAMMQGAGMEAGGGETDAHDHH
ncbi:MAG: hypothetical protein ACREMK_06375 [Gemmatimonadota bacterium]